MRENNISRRDFIKITGTTALSMTLPALPISSAFSAPQKFLIEGVGQTSGYSVKALVKKVFDAAGGIEKFIAKKDVVGLKPNISWARSPNLAVTTHPEVMEAVASLCFSAGAAKVMFLDHTIHDARRCFAITGATAAAKNSGATLVHPTSRHFKDMNLKGSRLTVWPVFVPFKEVDKIINIPVAKVHRLSGLTLGMKNWIGAVGGRRNALHQDIHTTIVDLAQYFKPDLTLIDATRILVKNGPSGGSEADVFQANRLILSNDPVAADAKAATLFDINMDSLAFIKKAEKWGLGTTKLSTLSNKKVII